MIGSRSWLALVKYTRGSPDKSRIPEAKYHIIGVASTRGHEKPYSSSLDVLWRLANQLMKNIPRKEC